MTAFDPQPGSVVGEPIVGTYWREQYLEVKRQRDEARAEVERLRMEFHREHTEHAITYGQVEAENERLRAALEQIVTGKHLDYWDFGALASAHQRIAREALGRD